MAKELPYFKFEPNEWETGNIQMCSREDKGLFIDVCSLYWSRLGELPLKLAVIKLCGGDEAALDRLISEEILTVKDGLICIDFLNEQLQAFEKISKTNSRNVKKRWSKHKQQKEAVKDSQYDRNTTVSNSQYDRNTIREEKRREEESRKEKKEENRIEKGSLSLPISSSVIEEYLKEKLSSYFQYEKSMTNYAEWYFDTWSEADWIRPKAGKIKNWKLHIRDCVARGWDEEVISRFERKNKPYRITFAS